MRPSKTGLMLLSTPSITSNIASTSASLYAVVVEEEAETNMPSSYCFDEKPNAPQSKDAMQRSPHQARGMSKPTPSVESLSTFHFPPKAKLKKRHTFAQVTRHKLQKEQIQPCPGTYVEQATVTHPLSKVQEPRASVLQFSSYKGNSSWLNRKTKLLGVSTIDNAPPPLPERHDAVPKSPAPVLRIGSPMLLCPWTLKEKDDPQEKHCPRYMTTTSRLPNSASASSAPDIDKPQPTSPPKWILHRRSSRSTSISTSLSMYSQSSCALDSTSTTREVLHIAPTVQRQL